MDSNPIHHPSPAKTVKCSFLYYIQHLMLTRLVNGLEPHPPLLSSQKMKCSFLGYVHLLMISRAVRWTQTPSTTPLQPIKWNAHFWITFNFWWSAGLVDGLEPHPPPVSCQKMKCTYFDYVQLLMIGQAGQWTQTPSATPLQPKKWNAHFCITFNFWWLAALSDGLKPHLPPVSSQKNEILIFVLRWTSDDQLGWLMDSNLISHPSPAKKKECSFLDFVQLLMIGQAGQWTWTPSTTPLQPKTWNPSFKDYTQLLMIGRAEWWTQTPSTTPLQPKKIKCLFLDYVHFWWSAWLIDELELHLPPLSYQKNEMLNFWLRSTSDDQPSWSIDSNPICHPSPAKKMKCSLLDYVHFGWSARLVDGLKPHPPPLSSQNSEMLIFVLHSTSDVGQTGQWIWTSSTTPLQPKK